MPICPQGHDSPTDDYCDVCGWPMAAPGARPSAPPPVPSAARPSFGSAPGPGRESAAERTQAVVHCPICNTVQTERYCEECGYDYELASSARAGHPGAALPGTGFPGTGRPGGEGDSHPSYPSYPSYSGSASTGPAAGHGYGYPGQPPQPAPAAERPAPPPASPPAPAPAPPPAPAPVPAASQPPGGGPSFGTDFLLQPPGAPEYPSGPAAAPPPPAQQQPAPTYQPPPPSPAPAPPAPSYQPPPPTPGPAPSGPPPAPQQPYGQPGYAPQAPYGQTPPPPQRPTWMAVVAPDREYFAATMARSGPEAQGLTFPPYAPERRVPLSGRGGRLRIGRRSHQRGTVPEIDLAAAPEDPGASHQHALLQEQPDGGWVIIDQDSTNGTTLNGSPDPIPPHVPVPLNDGDRIHIGAWTTITLHRA